MDFSMPRSTDSSSSACPSSKQHDPEMKPPSALQEEEEGREAEETIALPRHGYDDQHPQNHSSAVSSSSRRFPCRARSISNHHTPDNAYVNVPDNAPHGQLLCCSHPECVKSGRRFRYCRGMYNAMTLSTVAIGFFQYKSLCPYNPSFLFNNFSMFPPCRKEKLS